MAAAMIGLLAAFLVAPARAEPLEELNQQTLVLFQSNKFAEASAVAERAAAEARAQFGGGHTEYARALRQQANTLFMLRRYREAEPLFKQALEIFKAKLPAGQAEVAGALHDLGNLYHWQDKNSEAEQLMKQALAIQENIFSADDPGFLETATELGGWYMSAGRREEGEKLLLRVLSVAEGKLGADHPYIVPLLSNLSALRMLSMELSIQDLKSAASGAADLKARTAAIAVKAIKNGQFDGPARTFEAFMVSAFGSLITEFPAEGKMAEADYIAGLIRRFRVKTVSATQAYTVLFGGAPMMVLTVYEAQNKHAEYEAAAKQYIELLEQYLVYEPNLKIILVAQYDLLAQFYERRKNFGQAEICYRKLVEIKENGPSPLEAVEALAGGPAYGNIRVPEGLSGFYEKQKRFAEGEEALAHALVLVEKHQGGNSPDAASLRQRLAQWRKQHGSSPAQAAVPVKSVPAPAAASSATGSASGCSDFLALIDNWDARKTEAQKYCPVATWTKLDNSAFLLKGTGESLFGANEYVSLAQERFEKSDWVNAVSLLSRSVDATAALQKRFGSQNKMTLISWFDTDNHPVKPPLVLIKAAHRLAQSQPSREPELLQTGFVAAQRAHMPAAAVAVAQMVARQAAGKGHVDAALARLVRERQDLVTARQELDQQSLEAARQSRGDRQAQAAQERRIQSDTLDARLAEIEKTLAKEFPEYAALAYPAALTVPEAQAQLNANEALLVLTDTPALGMTFTRAPAMPAETFVWVITKRDARWVKAGLDSKSLAREVQALRCGLDETQWTAGSKQRKECVELLNKEASPEGMLPFDLGRSHALYQTLFGQANGLITSKHLLIVPTGPFTALPFQVLVQDKPSVPVPANPDGYVHAKWFGAAHAITILPSVSSLKALRARANASSAAKPFIGFGNPQLDGADGQRGAADAALRKQACPANAVASAAGPARSASAQGLAANSLFRGGSVDVAALRQVSPLPESADELCAIARSLGAGADDVWLGARMTETNIKYLNAKGRMADYRVLHFATHGLVAGEAELFTEGKAEPSLLFTPPATASETDDGLFTASEVSQLKLDADWVVLSACNTAAGDAKEAEALAGLARAFFYAGARALLVTHWSINSDAAVALTTGAFSALKAEPGIGRAEALRRSQLALIAKGGMNAHPSNWAPLVLVGEGEGVRAEGKHR
jgi:CHAT domain-containing protein